jgi:catechol 2,3-dioxygenase-like lactoylglutathione lyase family enzyme
MKISHYLHTAILVTDLERAEQFYSQVLGLEKVNRTLKYPGAWYQLGEIQVHLIVDTDFVPTWQNPQTWGRNPHLALAVKDLAAAKAHLNQHGCEMQLSASGRAALFIQDPDGNIIELSEIRTKDCSLPLP